MRGGRAGGEGGGISDAAAGSVVGEEPETPWSAVSLAALGEDVGISLQRVAVAGAALAGVEACGSGRHAVVAQAAPSRES